MNLQNSTQLQTIPQSNGQLQTIEFNGDQIVTSMVDGYPHVAMRPIVENLGLDWKSQHAKINAQKGKYNCGVITMVAADGNRREMLVMPVKRVSLWLASINPNKIKLRDKREKIELYQAECAEALFNYWHGGIAVRGDMDGVVTELDPKVLQVFGGVMKGIVNKQLTEHMTQILPTLIAQSIAEGHYGIVAGPSAGEVAEMAGVTDKRGLRGLSGFVSRHLSRFHGEKGARIQWRRFNTKTEIKVFDKTTCLEWLAQGGKRSILEYVEEKRGQSKLKLVK